MSDEQERSKADEVFKNAMFEAFKTVDPGVRVEEDTGFIVISGETIKRLREERKKKQENKE